MLLDRNSRPCDQRCFSTLYISTFSRERVRKKGVKKTNFAQVKFCPAVANSIILAGTCPEGQIFPKPFYFLAMFVNKTPVANARRLYYIDVGIIRDAVFLHSWPTEMPEVYLKTTREETILDFRDILTCACSSIERL